MEQKFYTKFSLFQQQNEIPGYSPSYSQHSPRDEPNPSNSEKSSTRRKQKCPSKAASELPNAGDDSDEDNLELAPLAEQQPQSIIYHQEIVNISPVTVTCSSNGREEIVGYNQSQFLDEVRNFGESLSKGHWCPTWEQVISPLGPSKVKGIRIVVILFRNIAKKKEKVMA